MAGPATVAATVASPKKAFALNRRSRPTTSTTRVWLTVVPKDMDAADTNARATT